MKKNEKMLSDNDNETFSERLERLLADKQMQKMELAEKIGFSANGISTWKVTGTIPRADIAIKIAKVLDVTTEYLIFGTYEGIDEKKDSLAYKVAKLPLQKKRIIEAVYNAISPLETAD